MKNVFPITKIDNNKLFSIKGDLSYFYEIDSIDLEQFDENQTSSFFQNLAIKLNHLEENKFLKFYHLRGKNYLNSEVEHPDISRNLKEVTNPMEIFFRNKDLYSNLEFYDDYVVFNGKYLRALSILNFSEDDSYPNILNLGYDYVLNIKRISNTDSTRKLEMVRNSHKASMIKAKTDFESEGAYQQAEDLLYDLTHSNECLFDIELFFLPSSDSLEGLNKSTFGLISELQRMGLHPYLEGNSLKSFKTGLNEQFLSLIPGVRPLFKYRNLTDKTSHLKHLLPLNRSQIMDEGTQFIDVNSSYVYLDFFSKELKNRNILVTGSSGGGKSVLVNKIVYSLANNHPVVILDKEGSFRKNCLYFDGEVLGSKINPLEFRCPYYLREFILSVIDKKDFDKKKRGQLLKEIKEFLDISNSYNFYDLLNHLEKNFIDISFYFEDLNGFITSDLSKGSKFLYVDIDKFPKSQVSPLIIYTLEYYKNIKDIQKVLVIDECYSFLKGHEKFVDETFRQIRKSGAMAIAIAQGYGDFSNENNELYTSLTNNSYFKFFFMQDYIDDPNITEFDNDRIQNLTYQKGVFSECYLKAQDGKYKKKLVIMLTPLEYELFNTEKQDTDLFDKFYLKNREYFKDNKETIDAYVRLHHETV